MLREFESRNVTFLEADGSWPIVWDKASGVRVLDVEGRKYLDLTAAFGVAAAGHANPRVVRAGQRQMARLLHAMGDVHPHRLKGELARELSQLTFGRWGAGRGRVGSFRTSRTRATKGKTIFCNSGFEAVEAALKTALLATGKAGIIAFAGAYHGLGYGALNATHRVHFRGPFKPQLRQFCHFVPFPGPLLQAGSPFYASLPEATVQRVSMDQVEAQITDLLRCGKIGAVLVEPIQVRGGLNVPPPDFLPRLRQLCDDHEALLILDEIYTGFGRTGKWFACEHWGVVPDLICLGKALTGGFPLSACVGRAELMDSAWPPSTGEAIHTSTFLGHPVGCAMALAQLREIRSRRLVQRSARLGGLLRQSLFGLPSPSSGFRWSARGVGLLAGLEVRRTDGTPAGDKALRVVKSMLQRGFILLPEGHDSEVIGFSPPLTITAAQLRRAVRALGESLLENCTSQT